MKLINGEKMPTKRIKTKTETISHTVKPIIKNLLGIAAELENRSKANMLEIIILDYCKKHKIKIKD